MGPVDCKITGGGNLAHFIAASSDLSCFLKKDVRRATKKQIHFSFSCKT